MPELTFTLRVTVPELVDAFTLSEIDGDAEPHDLTQAAAIERWLGGRLDDAANWIAATLPDDWTVRAGHAVYADDALQLTRARYRELRDAHAAANAQRLDDDDRRAADGDEQRDYAEERANAELLRDE